MTEPFTLSQGLKDFLESKIWKLLRIELLPTIISSRRNGCINLGEYINKLEHVGQNKVAGFMGTKKESLCEVPCMSLV